MNRKNMKKSFHVFFNDFVTQYQRQLRTCFKYVRDSNLNQNLSRHWFFSYIRAYSKLEELGYLYLCNRKRLDKEPP